MANDFDMYPPRAEQTLDRQSLRRCLFGRGNREAPGRDGGALGGPVRARVGADGSGQPRESLPHGVKGVARFSSDNGKVLWLFFVPHRPGRPPPANRASRHRSSKQKNALLPAMKDVLQNAQDIRSRARSVWKPPVLERSLNTCMISSYSFRAATSVFGRLELFSRPEPRYQPAPQSSLETRASEASSSATNEAQGSSADGTVPRLPSSFSPYGVRLVAAQVTHRHIAWAAAATLKDCLEQDFRIMQVNVCVSLWCTAWRGIVVCPQRNRCGPARGALERFQEIDKSESSILHQTELEKQGELSMSMAISCQ